MYFLIYRCSDHEKIPISKMHNLTNACTTLCEVLYLIGGEFFTSLYLQIKLDFGMKDQVHLPCKCMYDKPSKCTS